MTPAPHVKGKLSESTRQEMIKAMVKHLVALHGEGAAGEPGGQASGAPQQESASAAPAQNSAPQQPGAPMQQEPVAAQGAGPAMQAPQLPNVIHVVHHIAPSGGHGKSAPAPQQHKAPERK